MKPLTDAQRETLEAIEIDDVRYRFGTSFGTYETATRGVSAESVRAALRAGFALVGASKRGRAPVVLTDSGRGALQEARER